VFSWSFNAGKLLLFFSWTNAYTPSLRLCTDSIIFWSHDLGEIKQRYQAVCVVDKCKPTIYYHACARGILLFLTRRDIRFPAYRWLLICVFFFMRNKPRRAFSVRHFWEDGNDVADHCLILFISLPGFPMPLYRTGSIDEICARFFLLLYYYIMSSWLHWLLMVCRIWMFWRSSFDVSDVHVYLKPWFNGFKAANSGHSAQNTLAFFS